MEHNSQSASGSRAPIDWNTAGSVSQTIRLCVNTQRYQLIVIQNFGISILHLLKIANWSLVCGNERLFLLSTLATYLLYLVVERLKKGISLMTLTRRQKLGTDSGAEPNNPKDMVTIRVENRKVEAARRMEMALERKWTL